MEVTWTTDYVYVHVDPITQLMLTYDEAEAIHAKLGQALQDHEITQLEEDAKELKW